MLRKELNSVELEKLQQELFKEREKFSLFLSLNTNCFFEYDEKSRFIFFAQNENFKRLNGLVIELSQEEKFIQATGIFYADYKQFVSMITNKEDDEKEIRFLSDEGDFIWCRVKTAVIEQADGSCQVIGCVNDNDDNHKKLEWLKEQSQLDTLTRFLNKQYMKEYTELFLSDCDGTQKGSLFLIDIDHFKRINNNMGRLFSDTVLSNIAESIRHTLPEDSIFGRVVDDEFAVFVKNIGTKEEINIWVERINFMLDQIYAGENDRISCCMGISRYPQDGKDYDTLFRMADASLFRAKAKGDQTVELFDSEAIKEFPVRFLDEAAEEEANRSEAKQKSSGFSEEIMFYAQELMSTTKDVYSAIHMLLEKLSREYGAASVEIYEKVKGRKILTRTYGYNSQSHNEQSPGEELDYNVFASENHYFDRNGLRLAGGEKGSLLECAFYEDGLFKGMLCLLDETRQDRDWTQEEQTGIVNVTKILSFYILRLNMTEKIQERVEHMKNYDALTGMPTLRKFKKEAIALLKENLKKKYAIVYSDIGNFKYINDVYGYQFGDRILYDFALELTRRFPKESIFGRISADNYVVLVAYEEEKEVEQAVLILSESFHDFQKERHVATNILIASGIYFLKPGELDISTAIDNANVARKKAKLSSFSTSIIYNDEMEEQIRKERLLSHEMEAALENGEFVVYLQPKVALENEALAGAEALVRWKKKNGEIIPPDEFIPFFERNGFILRLDFYVYEQVCQIIRGWIDKDGTAIPVSVNVSRVHLEDGKFVRRIKNLVDKYGIPPKYIELELTESVFVSDTRKTIDTMKELRDYGFGVSIDDFGAGYSSLTLLKDMETDVIKLDKEFFRHGEMKEQEQIIVSCIINMAKKLNMKVLSEGIETEKQTQFLKDICCDMVQGYYYAKPMPAEQFEEFMSNSKKLLAKTQKS